MVDGGSSLGGNDYSFLIRPSKKRGSLVFNDSEQESDDKQSTKDQGEKWICADRQVEEDTDCYGSGN